MDNSDYNFDDHDCGGGGGGDDDDELFLQNGLSIKDVKVYFQPKRLL